VTCCSRRGFERVSHHPISSTNYLIEGVGASDDIRLYSFEIRSERFVFLGKKAR